MEQYGLIGYPLGHSFSKQFFTRKFQELNIDAAYELYPLENIGLLAEKIAAVSNLGGFNVTIPYKEAILPFLSALDPEAEAVGAVNCVKVLRSGSTLQMKGFNTDIIGFEQSLVPLLTPKHTHALILGTGGAAKAVAYVLKNLGISYKFISRKGPELTYSTLTSQIIFDHKLIINTTPVGMYPDIMHAPDLPLGDVGPEHLVYDLIYNPVQTKLLELASLNGAAVKNGHEMLVLQAEASWEIWNNSQIKQT